MEFKTFKILITVAGILLFIQYGLGMVINLFAEIPAETPLDFLGYFGGVEVLVHIINGILILVVGLVILAYSIKINSLFSWLSLISVVFVAFAVIFGVIFITGGMNDSFSIAMAMSFISIYTLYFYEFYLTGKGENPNP